MVGRKLRFAGSSTHSPGHYWTRRSWAWTLAFSVWISFLELVHKLGDTTNWVVAKKHQNLCSHSPGGQKAKIKVWAELVPSCPEGESAPGFSLSLWSFWRSLGSLSLWTHCPMWASVIPGSLRLFLSSYKDTGHWYRAHPNPG